MGGLLSSEPSQISVPSAFVEEKLRSGRIVVFR
jgi:hypothetical protein